MIRFIVTSLFVIASIAINAQEYIYRKVTSQSQIEAGGVYVLAKGSGDFYYASGFGTNKITSTNIAGYSNPDEFCVRDAYEMALVKFSDEDGFRFMMPNGIYLQEQGGKLSITTFNDTKNYKWTININEETCEATIRIVGHSIDCLKYNSSNFLYTSQSSASYYPVILYRKVIAKATSSGYATFCSSKDVAISGGGMKAYVGTVMGNELVLTEVDKVKANEGVILFSETPNAQAEVTVTTLTDDEKALFSSNALKAASVAVTVDNDGVYYALTNDANGDAVFCPVEPGVVIPAGKAYLHLGATSPAKISINMFTPTTLSTERHTETPKDAYNLSGQKVGSGYHGIVITNGRKVIK